MERAMQLGLICRYTFSIISVPLIVLLLRTVYTKRRHHQAIFQSPFFILLAVVNSFDLLHCVKNITLEFWVLMLGGWKV